MRIADLNGKNVCILGFGKEGKSMFRAIEKYAPHAKITIGDQNKEVFDELINVNPPTPLTSGFTLQPGELWLQNIETFDVIIKSPGIPPNPQLAAVSSRITTPTNFFLDEVAAIGATVIGVTGSKGKSTTTWLIHSLLNKEMATVLCGNIGTPALDMLERISKNVIVVMEMSSYQLMDVQRSPHIAVLTSFFPEHLDYHGSLEAYFDAKANIVKFQDANDLVFFNAENADTTKMAALSKGKKIPFTHDECPLPLTETKLIGDHNKSNVAAAYKVAQHFGVPEAICLETLRTFEPLPHRLQFLGEYHGIVWIDDAISTTPDSTIAALRAVGPRVKTIILGGTDRGLEFDALAEELVQHSEVQTVILFPGSGPRIRSAIEKSMNNKSNHKLELTEANTMEDAVTITKAKTPQHMTCLLSTASPSYNMFKNFEEKGDMYKKCIQEKD